MSQILDRPDMFITRVTFYLYQYSVPSKHYSTASIWIHIHGTCSAKHLDMDGCIIIEFNTATNTENTTATSQCKKSRSRNCNNANGCRKTGT